MTMSNEAGRDMEVAVGAQVFTNDGDELGRVKEVRGHYFKVDHRMGPDFWLQREFIESSTPQRVGMQIAKADLDNYKVKEPDDGAIRSVEGQDTDGPGMHGENPASATIRAVEGGEPS